jgi:hypothetical protein
MRLARFLDGIDAAWPDASNLAPRVRFRRWPTSRRLSALPSLIPGLSTENILVLLNLAAAALEQDEVAVEIGSLHGLTLVGTALGNPDVSLYACDNFSRPDSSLACLTSTVARFLPTANIHLFSADYREFLSAAPWHPRRVGLFFYDGPHTFADQLAALLAVAPHLAESALLVVDDANDWPIRAALREAARQLPAMKTVLSLHTLGDHDRYWWNGVRVYHVTGSCSVIQRPASALYSPALWDSGLGLLQRAITLPYWLPGKIRILARSYRRRFVERS